MSVFVSVGAWVYAREQVPFLICRYRAAVLGLLKGAKPHSKIYKITPIVVVVRSRSSSTYS